MLLLGAGKGSNKSAAHRYYEDQIKFVADYRRAKALELDPDADVEEIGGNIMLTTMEALIQTIARNDGLAAWHLDEFSAFTDQLDQYRRVSLFKNESCVDFRFVGQRHRSAYNQIHL